MHVRFAPIINQSIASCCLLLRDGAIGTNALHQTAVVVVVVVVVGRADRRTDRRPAGQRTDRFVIRDATRTASADLSGAAMLCSPLPCIIIITIAACYCALSAYANILHWARARRCFAL